MNHPLRAHLAWVSALIWAVPLPGTAASRISADLVIKAQAGIVTAADSAHPAASSPATGNATQGATISLVADGLSSSAAVDSKLASSGRMPLGGMLNSLGDGIGITSTMNGADDGQPAASDGLFGDYSLSLGNRSAIDAYKISLRIDYAHKVQATGPAGPPDGAYSIGLATLTRGGTTLFSTSLTSDTVFGDKRDVTLTGASGQDLNDSGSSTIELSLKPGEEIRLQGQHDLRGAVARPGASYRGGLKVFISLAGVADLATPGPAVAGPGTAAGALFSPWRMAALAVLALGGAMLLLRLRRR